MSSLSFRFKPIGLLGLADVGEEAFVFSGSLEIEIANILFGSTVFLHDFSITGFALHQISSIG